VLIEISMKQLADRAYGQNGERKESMDSKEVYGQGLHLISSEPGTAELSDPKNVLEEVFELLEEFSPAWYSEELHKRAMAALKAH
jgi:hypothetical protein